MRRHANRATIMTSDRPIEEWATLIVDVPAATAILDRFLYQAEIINITGQSYQLNHSVRKSKGAKKQTCPSRSHPQPNPASDALRGGPFAAAPVYG